MKIIISELGKKIPEPILDELTLWEMKNINGGYMTRRDMARYNMTNSNNTTNTNDFSTMLKEINSSIAQWKITLEDTTDTLGINFNF
ncbi:hypothetical protein H6F39_15460 [Anabaena sp. FACHB-1250]|uniref:Uncharacterized protein n=1 Tax=Dolichospermum planctonicum TaxID=136072 RepID=A0A480A5W6_9CYAN|nr:MULTISPECIES: hypothetical protein [Nostocales]MBD2142721.1 hypothetical protein [Anabaena sp. FACHB-1250]GCL40450.1 hypothetical protein NIES80_01370 [Dolichospermum planctonicum]